MQTPESEVAPGVAEERAPELAARKLSFDAARQEQRLSWAGKSIAEWPAAWL